MTPAEPDPHLRLATDFVRVPLAGARTLAGTEQLLFTDEVDAALGDLVLALLQDGELLAALRAERRRLLLRECRSRGAPSAFDRVPELAGMTAGATAALIDRVYGRQRGAPTLTTLQQVIALQIDLASSLPEGVDNGGPLHNLGLSLHARFALTGQHADLALTVAVAEQAVDLAPPGHPARANRLVSMGKVYLDCHETFNDAEALDDAEAAFDEAQKLMARPGP
ncbi:hypothetical protein [Actinoplanes sp. NBRC 101535]|uniref:hypothetical protein n=1 Tax=Actinoplanes sp. NBRC 101535 TaxID=3032196 RepID=UPI0024A20E31|nr:hypothetical protein [Actinoplanes sp. NBRC 101535]GLY07094.1 hypothetical protein Acsp01_74730 [Actinoplanes sp. NBRC 101535]